jgi:beta-glucosidase
VKSKPLGILAGVSLAVASFTAVAVPASASTPASVPGAQTTIGRPWMNTRLSADQRARLLVARMTLDEKIAMVHGAAGSAYTGYIPGDSRLCIPALKLQDGPVGVRMNDTTQLPSAADLAASFDTSLARSYGGVIGAEDKTKGVDVDLGPTVNIVRDPRWGRAFESYSEDPYLTGEIGAADINGIQSKGVMAQVKHWAVYNQETNRNTPDDDVIIDDRTVHEIYTAAFGRIVAESHPSSAMCSYSTINGTYACESAYLNEILKKEFGFDGFITSDWGATHSTVASANAGMDMQMPDDSFFGAALKQAVQDGQVAQSRVDDMVSRILREQFRFGLFDHPSPDTPDAYAATPQHIATARDVAEQGAVLLKNNDHLLPLGSHTHSIAVIGDGAGPDTMSRHGHAIGRHHRAGAHRHHGLLRAGQSRQQRLPGDRQQLLHATVGDRQRAAGRLLREHHVVRVAGAHTGGPQCALHVERFAGTRCPGNELVGEVDRHAHAPQDGHLHVRADQRRRQSAVHQRSAGDRQLARPGGEHRDRAGRSERRHASADRGRLLPGRRRRDGEPRLGRARR